MGGLDWVVRPYRVGPARREWRRSPHPTASPPPKERSSGIAADESALGDLRPAVPSCQVLAILLTYRGVPLGRAQPPPMTEHEASRTLVKSPPELWAECSDAASLARHLDRFGEIRITRLDPETAVAWEGGRARGTVRVEPAG